MIELSKTTFPITLTYNTAWELRERIKPGLYIPDSEVPKELKGIGHVLRAKINNALLQFENSRTEDYSLVGPTRLLTKATIELNRNEGWILDQALKYDGYDGAHTHLLLQVFRGLEELGPDPTLDF